MKNGDVGAWFDENGYLYSKQVYSYAQECRADFIKKQIRSIDGLILDVGIGSGELVSRYIDKENNNKTIVGLDISQTMLDTARKRCDSIRLVKADAESLPFRDEFFDAILCSEVLYYLENPDNFIRESMRVLKKNGNLMIIINNQYWYSLDRIRGKFRIGPMRDIHRKFFYPSEVKTRLIEKGFRDINIEGFCVVPFRYFRGLDETILSKFGLVQGLTAKKMT